MAEEETEKEYNTREEIVALRKRFQNLTTTLKESSQSALDATSSFCHDFCQVLVEHGGQWKPEEDPFPVLEMYTVAILNYAEALPSLSAECEHVSVVLEKLALSCLDLLLSLSEQVPGALWEKFQSSVKTAHGILQQNGNSQLHTLSTLAEESGVWTNTTLCSILSGNSPDTDKVHELLAWEGPVLLDMRIKHLLKQKSVDKAVALAKVCSDYPEFMGKKNFKQIYLVCLSETKSQEELMQEIAQVDCKDALDMICNLESDGDEKGALSLCTAFFKRQLAQGDVYCAWELTLFWSKLLIRLESVQSFLDQCRLLARLSGSVYHILLLIKVIQEEVGADGLPLCIEMCIRALQMGISGSEDYNSTICKTISCLLPADLEVKRACQLTEFLVKPTVDSYYAVETLFNEPDQKLEEESLPIPNSLRCDLLLALKTQWPFDPEFWDWRTLKRQCLSLMGEEASIVLSIDKLNDSEDVEDDEKGLKELDFILNPTNELDDSEAEKQKKREMKKLREKGFVSARFRNWQAYMQYCVLCDKEFLGHRIVKHALKHVQDGIFRCPICAKTFEAKTILEPHVASHVKQSCKERLAAMKASKKTQNPSKPSVTECKSNAVQQQQNTTIVKENSKTKSCPNNVSPSDSNFSSATTVTPSPPKRVHTTRQEEKTEDCSCPVTSCQKVFKYFRNLVAHVKAHKNDEEAKRFLEIQCQKVVCQYCRRQFVNVTHLNDHLQMHCGTKPYCCIQLGCKASFHSHAELLMHRKVHTEFQAQCMFPNCGKVFSEAYQLYDHEAQHYIMFTCKNPNCGKIFYSQSQLNLHQSEHVKNEVAGTFQSQTELPLQGSLVHEYSSNQIYDVPRESSPLKIKHSVESMLNSGQDSTVELNQVESGTTKQPVADHQSQTGEVSVTEPKQGSETSRLTSSCLNRVKNSTEYSIIPCYVKVEPIPINCHDPIFLNAARSSDSLVQTLIQDKKLYSCMWNNSAEKTNKNEPANHVGKTDGDEAPQTHSMQSSTTNINNNAHVCPFEKCTRQYSTSKSLSRHVKNVHSEAYEGWKLSKKYKRIAEIAARKVSAVQKTSGFQTPNKGKNTSGDGPPQQDTGIRPLEYQVDSTVSGSLANSVPASFQPFGDKFCPPFESPHNATTSNHCGLMRAEMPSPWASSALNNCNSDFAQENHYPLMTLTDHMQTYQPYHSENSTSFQRDMEYTQISADDDRILPTMNSDSSVMNEASKYVSSSLRVLHALNVDQPYQIPHAETTEGTVYTQIRENTSMISHNSSLLPSGTVSEQGLNPYLPTLSAEANPIAVQELSLTNKAVTTEHTNSVLSSDVKNITHLASLTCKEEPESDAGEMPNSDGHRDFTYKEASQSETQTVPLEDKKSTSSDETKKAKKIRSSKRTKWPAIIKDGKVICCRCYREFSSTKSLGGHLSKRSQCKPIDEVDLTADLPVSFLDFLNAPDVTDVLPQAVSRNKRLSQSSDSATYQQSESKLFHNDSFNELYSPNFDVENCNLPSSDLSKTTLHESEKKDGCSSANNPLRPSLSSSSAHPDTQTGDNETASVTPGEDGIILEIQKALQRLDLVDASPQEMPDKNAALATFTSDAERSHDQCRDTKVDGESQKQQNVSKPFRCDAEGCLYGAMTKEALFKHLYRVHNYNDDMINELKKNPDRFTPYRCHLCLKTFTRTTGLRIHYKNVHRMSKEELDKLKIGWNCKKVEKSSTEAEQANNSSNHPITSLPCPSSNLEMNAVPNDVSAGGDVCDRQTALRETEVDVSLAANDAPTQSLSSNLDVSSPVKITTGQENPSVLSTCNSDHDPDTQNASGDVPEQVVESPCPSGTIGTGCDKISPEKKDRPKKINMKVESDVQKREKTQKKSSLKADSIDTNDAVSPYRPYRCVHEGCVAAFSIQQNLILHYRAMHQSDRDDEIGVGNDQSDGATQEFKCQVKDCSKVLSKVPSLLKHYLILHRCTLEKASALVSGIELGTFQCDQSKCSATFTSHLKYIDHIKNDHKAIRISEDGDFETVDVTFQCEWEGCDRIYTTKSNLLRHLMKKHHATFETVPEKQKNGEESEPLMMKLKPTGVNPNNGKENIANSKFKMKKKNPKKKEVKARNHWTSFGKPSLKSIDEATAMCTKKFSLQYPCMIKGCESVLNAERNIFKHYTTHGLTERYIEDQRSQFIFCKKNSRSRNKDDGTLDAGSTETSEREETDSEGCDNSTTSVMDQGNNNVSTSEAKESADEVSESAASAAVKRKRGRPRKSEQKTSERKEDPERKLSRRNCTSEGDNVNVTEVSESTTANTTVHVEKQAESGEELKILNPMGFEKSFLKLIEESSPSINTSKRKTSEIDWAEMPTKRQRTLQQQTANIMNKRSDEFRKLRQGQNVVHFRNPLKLESVKNVKIVMDKTFSNGADLLLKQLQDMRPMVILKKWLYS
ncbi:zinc finger protein 292a [Chanos chanos]|uniref:Zinc finger protein 292a n=1 Tax=Chanos chanos TaxID=29144 RepID=A0A6J2W5E7_CHACN|nr:zinc finger protein 292-like [Chanos chanos]